MTASIYPIVNFKVYYYFVAHCWSALEESVDVSFNDKMEEVFAKNPKKVNTIINNNNNNNDY